MQKKDWLLLALTGVLCVVFMLPRILSAQFGLLDDGVLLKSAQAALKDLNLIWYQFKASGRFLPTALFFRAAVFGFAGFSAELWYVWMTVQLIATTLVLVFISRLYKATRLQTLLCVLIFLASPALVENYYTLSKSETLLVLFIAGAILIAYRYPALAGRLPRIISILCTYLLLLLGFGAKETAIVLPFLFFAWLVVSWLVLRRTGEHRASIQSELILLVTSVASGASYWLLRSYFGITTPESTGYVGMYQLLNIDKFILNFSALVGWIVRDFPYLLPVLLGILWIKPLRQAKPLALILKWGLWMAVWASVLIPWYLLAYYLLPFLFGAALVSGMVLGQMVHLAWPKLLADLKEFSRFEQQFSGRGSKLARVVLSALVVMLLLPPTINATAFATEQLIFDRANWRFIQNMASLPPNSRLILDLPVDLEYFHEIKLWIRELLQREDLAVEGYQPPVQPVRQQNTYIANIVFQNQLLPSVRTYHAGLLMIWKSCLQQEADAFHKVFSTQIIRPVLDIGLHRLLPFLKMGDLLGVERPIFFLSHMTYGWEVNQFVPARAGYARPAVYQNGVFILQTASGNTRSVRFGEGSEIPLAGDLDGDGYSDLVLYRPKDNTWFADLNLDGIHDRDFSLAGMQPGDIPFLGDWDGDGDDTPGFYRPSEVDWYLFNGMIGDPGEKFHFGAPTDVPLIGDWNGDGKEDIGIYRPGNGYSLLIPNTQQVEAGISLNGLPGSIPVAGFWDATNKSQLAFVKGQTWTLQVPAPGCVQPNPAKQFTFDAAGVPLAGFWRDR